VFKLFSAPWLGKKKTCMSRWQFSASAQWVMRWRAAPCAPVFAPLFDALGQRTTWVGGVGVGTRLKLVSRPDRP
jgi:hypothetical protein